VENGIDRKVLLPPPVRLPPPLSPPPPRQRARRPRPHQRQQPRRRQPQRQLLPGLRGGAGWGRREALGPGRGQRRAEVDEEVGGALVPAPKAAKDAAPTIAFSVIELTGKELPMTTLSALHTVGELKQEVARASSMRAEQVRLVLKNEVMDDESRTLSAYGVEAGSQVTAVSQSVEE
jgi:hypothetical protein